MDKFYKCLFDVLSFLSKEWRCCLSEWSRGRLSELSRGCLSELSRGCASSIASLAANLLHQCQIVRISAQIGQTLAIRDSFAWWNHIETTLNHQH